MEFFISNFNLFIIVNGVIQWIEIIKPEVFLPALLSYFTNVG